MMIMTEPVIRITVEFNIGAPSFTVFEGSGENLTKIAFEDIKGLGLLKRKMVFKDYEWPEGDDAPPRFTFHPESGATGGSVRFGSGFADARIYLKGDNVFWDN